MKPRSHFSKCDVTCFAAMLAKIITHAAGRCKLLNPSLFRHGSSERALCHSVRDLHEEEPLPWEWYRAAYGRLIRLTRVLRNVEQIDDGRITNASDGSVVTDARIIAQMKTFNSLTKAFVGACFDQSTESSTLTLNSLTKVCNLLNISAQKRKHVRLAICPQVTQHHIWRGALEEVLRDLKHEINTLGSCSPSVEMGEQILMSCIEFFSQVAALSESEPPSWMKPPPLQKVERPVPPRTWEEVLEMIVDLTKCLEREEQLAAHVSKLEAMKEGLYQIRDIVMERNASYKEVRMQDCLVQRKLSKSLGHSSRCLFTLLLYYLYGSVRSIEVEVCGGIQVSGDGDHRSCLHIGKILTCSDEGMVQNGIKQLSRALGVFKFVWETAAMGGVLEVQGHLWCVGAQERRISYRGNSFLLHAIRL